MAIFGTSSSMGLKKSANLCASSGLSLMPSMRVKATMMVRVRMAARVLRASTRPSRSSTAVCRVDGTRRRRISSSGLCKLHASVPGMRARRWNVSGDGPTVLMVIFAAAMAKRSRSANAATASPTASKFRPASPIPMNTTLLMGGMRSRAAMCKPLKTCDKISADVRLRSNPIFPVKQNAQPRSHPICVDTHSVVRSNL